MRGTARPFGQGGRTARNSDDRGVSAQTDYHLIRVNVRFPTPRFQSFSGTVNDGDVVLLTLYFSGSDVVMSAYDSSTGARASQSTVRNPGSSYFHSFYSLGNMAFFTGLMTEWYHANSSETGMSQVAYSVNGNPVTSGRVCVDERLAHDFTSPSVYSRCSDELSLDSRLQPFSFHGLKAYASAAEFVTGPS